MAYVDGFLIPVPTKNLTAYRKMSQKAGAIWMEYGALDYKECAGDDMTSEGMKRSSEQRNRRVLVDRLRFESGAQPHSESSDG